MKLGYRLGWFTSFFCNININIERERETETETETETERQRVWSNGWWFSLFMHLLKKFIRVGLIDLFSSWYLRNNDFARLSPDLRVIWKFLKQSKTLENLWVGFILFLTRKCLLGSDSNAKFNIYICKITSCRVMLHSNLYYHKKFHYSLS